MIQETEYIKYDMEGHFYYLTEAGLTELTDVEPDLWNKTSKRLKTQGRLLHQDMVDSRYNGKPILCRQDSLIEYKIFLNKYNEVEAIQKALIIFAELSEYDDLDLKYRNGEKRLPNTLLQPLRNANIYFKGELIGFVPEEEYRNGY